MKILFVCTGNICRSHLAEGILRNKMTYRGLEITIHSCGFESFHVGDAPDIRAQIVANRNGIDISGHRARLFRTNDFDEYDRIYVMDSGHYQKLMKLARNGSDKKKVTLIMNACHPGENISVPDPWYDSMPAFENVFSQLDDACEAIASEIESTLNKE